MNTALVIMAAGIGSRFGGGIKQLEPVGPNGEIIMDYSIHDAIAAGFNKIIFIIRKDIEEDFREVIGNRIEEVAKKYDVEIAYAFQDLKALPEGIECPEGRTKPWGTGQAVLACDGLIHEPFAVINADDYYGKEAFVQIHDFLLDYTPEKPDHLAMAGFILKNTLSDNGGVTRGICAVNDEGYLTDVEETKNIEKTSTGARVGDREIDPNPGAVIGGLVLGEVEALGISWLGDGAHDLITFGALLIILIVRPQGLLGKNVDVKSEPLTGTFLGGGRPITLPWWGNLIGAVALLATPFFFNDYLSGIGTQVAIYAIAAVGLTLISGSAGQTILGMAGPFAVGAYASAILTTQLKWPFLLSLIAAGLIAAIAASILTFPVWKLAGHYVAIATIGVGYVMVAIIRLAEPLTKGSLGIQGIPFPNVFGQALYTQQMQYLLDVVVLLVALVVVSRIRSSHLGHVFEAVGSDQDAAEALSIRTSAYKALAYALAAFFAGLAGSLLAHQYTYIDPTIFNVNMSLLILTVIVMGGMNSPLGAVLGAVILIGAPELLRFASDARVLLYGVLLVLVILFRPQGLFARKV